MKRFTPLVLVLITGSGVMAQDAASKVTAELIASSSIKVVKNAPFTADAVSESRQTMPGGDQVVYRTTVRMTRDSEGRFRVEVIKPASNDQAVSAKGGHTSLGIITIFDPVKSVRYILDPGQKTVRKIEVKTSGRPAGGGQAGDKHLAEQAELERKGVVINPFSIQGTSIVSADLGTKSVEGIEARGSRTTTTIPANTFGNARSIEITYRRWFSDTLDLIVYSSHYDPRFGEQTYRLTNLDQREPERTNFVVPEDFRVVDSDPVRSTFNPSSIKPGATPVPLRRPAQTKSTPRRPKF